MKPKYIQVDCPETNEATTTQADAVLRYQPDIILLEYPNNNPTPNTIYNNFSPAKKPFDLIEKQKESLKKSAAETDPWITSDIVMWDSVVKLWREEKQCLVYRTDAPNELVNKWHVVWSGMYPASLHNWLWWVQIYIREKYMAKNISWVLSHYKSKENPVILVFLQFFHWLHVRFLLKNPTREQEWEYYFGKRFKNLTPQTIEETLKQENKVFLKYWSKISRFKTND